MHLFRDLSEREKSKRPILVGVIGCGFFGAGVVRQLVWTPGVKPAVIANRTVEKAVTALKKSGVSEDSIRICKDAKGTESALEEGLYAVTSDLNIPSQIKSIEVITETTGNIVAGVEAALNAIEAKKHFVAANPEAQATVGAILKRKADQAGVIYSDMDGDQPGILQKLYDHVEGIGFQPVVAGNCKGVMKRYATPETQKAYCLANQIQPWIATAAADGTKLNIEMCIVANANGMRTARRGMTGVQTCLETLMEDFASRGLLERGKIVEYTLGIPTGVFVIGYHAHPWIHAEMRYFKMGDGPYYLFFHPHVLCQFEAVPSIAQAVLYRSAVIAPRGMPSTDVVTFAKRDLKQGERIDGIGGFDCYGLLVNTEDTEKYKCLPVGLAEFFRLKRGILKDQPIGWNDVEKEEENVLTRLWDEQAELFAASKELL